MHLISVYDFVFDVSFTVDQRHIRGTHEITFAASSSADKEAASTKLKSYKTELNHDNYTSIPNDRLIQV